MSPALIAPDHFTPNHTSRHEVERGVRDIRCYLGECQLSSQIAVNTHSLIVTDFTQLGLHVDMTGLSNVKQVIKLKHSSDDKY